MYRPSFAIMHAPWGDDKRKKLVSDMAREIEGVEVVRAVKGQGIWATAREAWLGGSPRDTHRVVLQDDIVLCGKFREAVEATIAAIPSGILSYYTQDTYSVEDAANMGNSWVVSLTICAPAICMPRPVAYDFVAWADRHDWHLTKLMADSDDARVIAYCKVRGCPVFSSVPCLVEHVGQDSLWKNREEIRRAAWWPGKDFEPSSVDWGAGAIAPEGWFYECSGKLGKGWDKFRD
jgi:hypothetical protein